MRRLAALLAFAFIIAAAPLSAGTRSCTSSMVSLNICRTTSDVAYCLPIGTTDPDGAGPRLAPSTLLADAFAWAGNWQTPAACSPEMVDAGVCTVGQLGTLVPITKAQFADLQVRAFVMQTLDRYKDHQKHAAAQAEADAEPAPDVGN
jgi:hypothetical protein